MRLEEKEFKPIANYSDILRGAVLSSFSFSIHISNIVNSLSGPVIGYADDAVICYRILTDDDPDDLILIFQNIINFSEQSGLGFHRLKYLNRILRQFL